MVARSVRPAGSGSSSDGLFESMPGTMTDPATDSYSELLDLEDDRDEYLPLEQLKPVHLQHLQQMHHVQPQHSVYYELTAASTPICSASSSLAESSCAPGASNTPMYLGLDELGVDLVGHPGGMLPQHPQDPLDAQHAMDLQPQVDSTRNLSKKRKGSSYHDGSDFDDDTEDGKSCRTDDKKQNHSEIEKRRRNKMNTYITELSAMVCRNLSRKLDKLTVLRMAVQHLKKIHGSVNSYTEGQYKPAFLSDQELKHLILQTAEGFLFVVGCDRGRILFVSESVSQVLNFSPCDLLGQSWFDILHPKDIRKVKEQISVCPRDRLIDAKTMQPVRADLPAARSRLCPGKRRSFFCRMKRKPAASSGSVKEETDSESCGASAPSSGSAFRKKKPHSADRKYSVIQCTGYVKSWALENMGGEKSELVEGEGGESAGAACLSCLVAVGRLQPAQSPPPRPRPGRPPANTRPLQFTSRHDTVDGKFLFVDQRATLALGYLQQDLLDTSMFEYYHQKDKPHLFESYKTALSGEAVTTKVYGFRKVEGSYTSVQSEWKAFKNPWTKEIEYLIAKNFVIMEEGRHVDSSPSRQNQSSAVRYQAGDDLFSQSTDGKDGRGAREARDGLQKIMEASKSGRKIADDALASQRLRGNGDSSSTSTPSPSRQDCSSVEMKLSPLLSTDGCRGQPGRPSSSNQDPLPSPQLDSAGPDTKSLQQSPLPTSPVSQDAAPAEGTSFYGLRLGSLNSEGVDSSAYSSSVRNNVMLSGLATPDPGLANDEDMMEMMTPVMHEFPGGPGEGSDEAAMSVIMSLLEADAGLGGPVDFNGLPWPLP